MRRPKKIGSASAIAEHNGHLEGFLTAPKGQTTFSALTINYCHGLREGLETLTSSAPANNHRRSLREGLDTVTPSALINNHHRSLREGLEIWTSSASTNNQSRGLRERLETQLVSTTSISFVSGSGIPEDTPSSIQLAETGYALWRGHRRRSGIKDSISATHSLCEHTWEVILCMVLTNNGHLGPDIWPETPDQAEDTEKIMRTVWAEEVHRRQKASRTKTCSLSPSGKEARHVSPLISCYETIGLLNRHRFWIQSWASELIWWKNYDNW